MYKTCIVFALFVASALAANLDADASVVRFDSDIEPDGTYRYAYETSNGIAADESGVGGERAQGSFSYVSPEGENVQISYVADENGFQPAGPHIPTPPPIPSAIIRALEWIAANPASDFKK